MSPAELAAALPHTLASTELEGLGPRLVGKVRDCYLQPGRRVLVTTDRISAFDRVIGTVPFKGQVLNQLAAWHFAQTADIVPNAVLAQPDPNAVVAREARALPVEVVVRGVITGVTSTSLWTLYQQGVPHPYGLTLPPGLPKNTQLPAPVITPTSKAGPGEHDRPLSCAEVVAQGWVEPALWAEVERVALALFARGQALAAARGLILADTKYEFGLIDGRLHLIDEVHTPDSSRYWRAASYEARLAAGQEPEGLDKEHLRRWLASVGYTGEGAPPPLPPEVAVELAARYIALYEDLTGLPFAPAEQPAGPRLARNLAPWRLPDPTQSPEVEPAGEALDRPHEECGVVGLYTLRAASLDTARSLFFAQYALQHRGQESAGLATSDGRYAWTHKGMGLVSQVFTEENLRPLVGHLGIGHNRYSTTGSSSIRNAQPYLIETLHGPLAVAHNGNLTNTAALRRRLLERGVGLWSSSDSEVITQWLAAPPLAGRADGGRAEPGHAEWARRIAAFMHEAEGAYSLVLMTRDTVWGVRDPHGLRPLCLGELVGEDRRPVGWVLASESCALGTIGARLVRELDPGEILSIDAQGVHAHLERGLGTPQRERALCLFEHVYFARPDSSFDGETIHTVRQRLGERLAAEAPAAADVVIGVPDSAIPAALGYAQAAGLPFTEGLIKNRYIGRTFIQPSDRLRKDSAQLKYNPLRQNLEGRRVVLVDDSIVRGNTMGPLIRLLREGGGAAEVHIRISSPAVRHPCFMGVDMPTYKELIAHRMSVEEIAQHIGADSLAYLSVEGLRAAARGAAPHRGYCDACFSGRYPLDVRQALLQAREGGGEEATVRDVDCQVREVRR